MNIAALQLGKDVESTNEDVIVGGGGFTLPTGLYPMIVENAYLDKSSGGAMNINLHLKRKTGGNQVYKHTIYITSGDAKGNKPYYEKDGKKHPLPGYSLADQICKITAEVPLSQIVAEPKLVKLWDFDASAEIPREVPVVTEMLGKEIAIGMHLVRENKRTKQGEKWVDTNEAREFNEINKVFHTDGMTVTEKAAEATEAVFVEKWVKANTEDYVRDKFKPVAGAPASAGSTAPASTAAAAPDDLFND